MTHAKRIRTIAGVTVAVAGLVVAYRAGRARADGVPAKQPLVYSGFLEEEGQPVSGERLLGVAIVDAEEATLPGCDAADAMIPVAAGRFSIVFDDACASAVQAQGPELYLQVRLDGAKLGAAVKIAAVPFALDASRADGLTSKARSELAHPSCPVGYAQTMAPPGLPQAVVCKKLADTTAKDELVRVGTGATAFWIDRYEASVTEKPDGNGLVYFNSANSGPPGLSATGDAAKDVAYARSVPNAPPARYVTWLQAETVCRASGKRLPSRGEWLAAVRGTTDPGASKGMDGSCHTCFSGDAANCNSGAPMPRNTGLGTACISRWGAEDMIGNVFEWVGEWQARPHDTLDLDQIAAWPSGDVSVGVENVSALSGAGMQEGVPRVEQRGGSWQSGAGAGVFALTLLNGPFTPVDSVGFRCVIPR